MERLQTSEFHQSMRGFFAGCLYNTMLADERIWVVTADLGFAMLDKIRQTFPSRFLNVGAAEQAGMAISVGLALKGKIPFFYSITPFALYRPFEIIRNYVNELGVPVKIVGAGKYRDYLNDGFSHWAEEDKQVMNIFKNIQPRWPATKEEIPVVVKEMIETPKPFYLNLTRQ